MLQNIYIVSKYFKMISNQFAQSIIDECRDELDHILQTVDAIGQTSRPVPYMNKYAIIKASGTIERAFKTIIADYLENGTTNTSLQSFIDNQIRQNSQNPSYNNICSTLKKIDEILLAQFKDKVNLLIDKSRVLASLQSLVDDRNDLAHGGTPPASIGQTLQYYQDSIQIIECLDDVCQ